MNLIWLKTIQTTIYWFKTLDTFTQQSEMLKTCKSSVMYTNRRKKGSTLKNTSCVLIIPYMHTNIDINKLKRYSRPVVTFIS